MDFSYEYTPEQEDFRRQVSEWLERDFSQDLDTVVDSADSALALADLSSKLGSRGWLAPAEPSEIGGGELSSDMTVIVLEELNRRRLLTLVQSEAQALRTAVVRWGSSTQQSELVSLLARGERSIWRHRISVSPSEDGSGTQVDPDSVGVTATPDADGYVLNGTGLFTGIEDNPDILWTVGLIESENEFGLPVSLIVDSESEGVSFTRARTLTANSPRPVSFEDVWVLRSNALGHEGDGHQVINTRVSLDPHADLPTWVEFETDALLEYDRSTESGGEPLSADPIRAQILVEAYIASRVSRLLRMKSSWLRQQGEEIDASEAMASLWRRQAGAALADSARQVIGPRALLSADDPNAADGGRFERLGRKELAEREMGSTGDPDREVLASELGLGETLESSD